MTERERRLAAYTTGQLGWFTRAQAGSVDITDRQLRSRVQSGILDQFGVNTFRSSLAARSPRIDLQGLVLDVGEPCWVSGPTAAALHGFDGFKLAPPFHVSVLRPRDMRRIGHVIHTMTELEVIDRGETDGLPTVRAARTIIDLARHVDAAKLTAALDSALRDLLITERSLHERIAATRGSGRYGIPKLLDVIAGAEATRGGHSWLEREFLQVAEQAGLPRPQCQAVLSRRQDRLVRVDCRFPGTNVVVELLGYRFHRSKAELQRDAERANALLLDGFLVLQFTYDDVVVRPAAVVATVERARDRRSVSAIPTEDVGMADTNAGSGVKAWWAARPSRRRASS